jgi:hypothetical protein
MSFRKIPLLLVALLGLSSFIAYLYFTGSSYETFIKEQGHAHTAPHGGTLIVFGDHVGHVELLLDSVTGRLTAYLLDGHAEHPVRLSAPALGIGVRFSQDGEWQPLTLAARANPLTGETVGDTSEFSVVSPILVDKERFEVRIGELAFRGGTIPPIETWFPEGNELGH